MSEVWGSITKYNPKMAKKAAKMFNEFNELWPGGFGGGVPYTEERVHDWLDKTSALADLIALDPEGNPVGYCGLYPHWRDQKASYISILGVTPKVQGKKFGKRLLLKALEIAESKGYTRVDLHTWSGNLEAVPLYKKIGLFWVPETSVYMQDFIPGLLQIPIAKEYFSKHLDWYNTFKRELTQSQDYYPIEDMELYTYKFEEGNDVLIAEVDRYGWDFCGFERVLDGKKIIVKARIKSHMILIGIPNALTITLYNEYLDDANVVLDVQDFHGLKWKETFPKTIQLKKGETLSITREFIVERTAKIFKDNAYPSETIKIRLTLGDKNFQLIVSGKIQPAVKIHSSYDYKILPLGKENKIYFDIKNNSKLPLSGKISAFIEGLPKQQKVSDFSLKPEEIAPFEFIVKIPDDEPLDQYQIHATPILMIDNQEQFMPTYDLTLLPQKIDMIELVKIEEKNQLYLITDKQVVRFNLESGDITLDIDYMDGGFPLSHMAGPPFGLSLDRTLKYNYETFVDDKYYTVVLTAQSMQIPGLLMQENIRVTAGRKEIEYWVEYTNLNHTQSILTCARLTTMYGGFGANYLLTRGKSYLPIRGKIIEGDSITNMFTTPLIPDNVHEWHESWITSELISNNEYIAYMWKPETIAKINVRQGFLSRLESNTKELKPGEIFQPIHLWYCHGLNNLTDVRERWSQFINNNRLSFDEILKTPVTKAIEVKMQGENILLQGHTAKKELNFIINTAYAIKGNISLILPNGWEGHFVINKEKNKTISLPELKPFEDNIIDLEIQVPQIITTSVENIIVHLSGEFELDFNFPVVLTTNEKVIIKKTILDGEKVMEVSNGAIAFSVSSIGGNLIRLKDKKGRSFFQDTFPKVQPRYFFEYYLGGIQILPICLEDNNPFHDLEKVESSICEEGQWKGVKSTWIISKEKQYLYGQRVSVKYLTLSGSEVIRITVILEDNIPRELKSMCILLADIALQGSKQGNVIEAEGATQLWKRNPSEIPFTTLGSPKLPISRVIKEDQSISFIIPDGYNGSNVLADFGLFLVALNTGLLFTKPKIDGIMEFVIVLNHSREKSEILRKALFKKDS